MNDCPAGKCHKKCLCKKTVTGLRPPQDHLKTVAGLMQNLESYGRPIEELWEARPRGDMILAKTSADDHPAHGRGHVWLLPHWHHECP